MYMHTHTHTSMLEVDGRWWDAHGICAGRMDNDALSRTLEEASVHRGGGSGGGGVIKFAIQSVRMTLEEDMLTYG